jgi:hypothetical protein
MKIKIKGLPVMKQGGGVFNPTPFAGAAISPTNPFGLISSDKSNEQQTYNTSIKPICKDKANIEAEKGEVLFKFDAGGIFKIMGKRHSDGGTPLKADEGDFIFSNDRKLAITKTDADRFNLAFSGRGKRANTPAKILSKEIDFDKYNKFVTTLNDPNTDVIAKTTAQLMLGKYLQKIGQVGYLQEAKKKFPQGLPEFSQGTAPVYSNEVMDAEDKSEMFKYGGKYLPKAQMGIISLLSNLNKRQQDQTPGTIPTISLNLNGGPQNVFDKNWMNVLSGNPRAVLSKEAQANINQQILSPQHKRAAGMYGDSDWDKQDFMNRHPWYFGQNSNFDFSNPKDVSDFQTKYNDRANQLFGQNYFTGKGFRGLDGKFGEYTYNAPSLNRPGYMNQVPDFTTPTPTMRQLTPNNNSGVPSPNNISNVPEVPFQGFDIGMNGAEVLSGIMPYLSAASMPTYYDMLSQKYSPNIRLDRQDNTNEINQIQQQSSLAQRELFSNLRGKTAALATGDIRSNEALNLLKSNAQLAGENTNIANQESMVNYQADQQDNMFNIQQVHQTYNNNVLSRQRRNEQLANGVTQSLNNFLAIKNNLDTLNQQATSAVLPYLSEVDAVDEKGNPIKVQVSPIGLNKNRIPVPTGYGSLDSVGVRNLANAPSSDDYKAAYEYFLSKGVTPDKAAQAATIIFYGKNGQKNAAAAYNPTNPYAAMMSSLYNFGR